MQIRFLTTAMMAMALTRPAPAQVEQAGRTPPEPERTSYNVDAISFAALNSPLSRVDVFVQVSFENLSFVREEGRYAASYEMMISLFDSLSRLAGERLWTEQVKAATFGESVSSQLHSLTQRVFEVPPGKYRIVTVLRDLETKVPWRQERELVVQNYAAHAFALSDIMLVRRLTETGGRKSIVPNVSPNVGTIPDGFTVFFEAYNDVREDSVRFTASILNDKGEPVFTRDTTFFLAKGRNQVFMKVDAVTLTLGDYRLYVRATPPGEEERSSLSTTSRAIVVRWLGLPRGVEDLDLAIDQIRYLARETELDSIKEAETTEEKQRRFLEFWKKRDPNPATPRNEKMEEYYARVEYANKNFKHYVEGWRTDMGMVFIRFGPPSNVDRHPFDIDSKPYEVWSYYDINYQFVFVDQTGFGDYRLITPIWDVWQRARD